MNATPEEILTLIAASDEGGLGERMGIEWLEVGAQRTVARMPVAGNTQPFGLLHGGASAVIAESCGSVAAMLYAGQGRLAMGIELSCSHHKAARDGWVTATATPLSLGRTLATYEIAIINDSGERICTARLTCVLRDAPAAPANATGS